MTAYERTGWRDEKLSKRHKLYGNNAPLTNIDSFWIEYDKRIPVCIIEYKSIHTQRKNVTTDANIEALANLADMAKLPGFIVFYSDNWHYMINPINDIAKKVLPTIKLFTEKEYVEFIYSLRNRTAPQSLIRRLNG